MIKTWFRVYSDEIKGLTLKRLGISYYLLLLLRDKVTQQQDDLGIISGGKPIQDAEWGVVLDCSSRRIAKYRNILQSNGYIYTLKVYGNLKIWSVIGYHKWNTDTTHSTRISSLVSRVKNGVIDDINNGLIIPTNPSFNISVSEIPYRDENQNRANNISMVGSLNAKIGNSNKERTIERTTEKTNEISTYRDTSHSDTTDVSDKKNSLDRDIKDIYSYYMKAIGSKKRDPDSNTYHLIKTIITDESTDILKNCVDNYILAVDENKRWTFYAPEKFFAGNTYIRFLSPNKDSHYEPRRKPINPGEFINNKHKESNHE